MSTPTNPPPPPPASRDPELNASAMSALGDGPMAPLEKGHPKGLYLLFTVEMWERFSFYGMKAILMLYMTTALLSGGLGWSDEYGGLILGTYAGLVYLTPVIGGYLADRYLGTRRAMIIGGYVIAAGHFCMAAETIPTFFGGLGLIILGTGLFKSNVSTMVGQLYKQGDSRRDAAFTIFYMGINLGAFIAPLICAYLQESFGFRYGFAAAGVGMVLGQLFFLAFSSRIMPGIGNPPVKDGGGTTADRAKAAAMSQPLTTEERHRVWSVIIMGCLVVFFWTAFEQASSSLTIFARDRVDMTPPRFLEWAAVEAKPKLEVPAGAEGSPAAAGSVAPAVAPPAVPKAPTAAPAQTGKVLPVGWFQSVNPLLVIIMAPFFAMLWTGLARRKLEPSTPVKMGAGMLIAAAGFAIMVFAALESQTGAVNSDGFRTIIRVSPLWLMAAYLLHTMGELCLSPVGLSMVTKLAPVKFASLIMGAWFISNFVANFAAGVLGGLINKIGDAGFILQGQAGFFLLFVITPTVVGILTIALAPTLKKLMHGRG
ncbi:MAG: peptide MFS transporter [Pyrinomonadaceae bacterium]|nr:peptide MFS transporter [Phycisphaerales bacterium]